MNTVAISIYQAAWKTFEIRIARVYGDAASIERMRQVNDAVHVYDYRVLSDRGKLQRQN